MKSPETCSVLTFDPSFSQPTVSECGDPAVVWYALENGYFMSVCHPHKEQASSDRWRLGTGWRAVTFEEAVILTVMGT